MCKPSNLDNYLPDYDKFVLPLCLNALTGFGLRLDVRPPDTSYETSVERNNYIGTATTPP
jgi:hypothetical protein